jgi:hypothetical protein
MIQTVNVIKNLQIESLKRLSHKDLFDFMGRKNIRQNVAESLKYIARGNALGKLSH